VATYCPGVPAEAVHGCLQKSEGVLSVKCRKERGRLAAAQAADIRLNPELQQACHGAIAEHCKTVRILPPLGWATFRTHRLFPNPRLSTPTALLARLIARQHDAACVVHERHAMVAMLSSDGTRMRRFTATQRCTSCES
jgi:hypothetical protein